jgi:hypothetical protein
VEIDSGKTCPGPATPIIPQLSEALKPVLDKDGKPLLVPGFSLNASGDAERDSHRFAVTDVPVFEYCLAHRLEVSDVLDDNGDTLGDVRSLCGLLKSKRSQLALLCDKGSRGQCVHLIDHEAADFEKVGPYRSVGRVLRDVTDALAPDIPVIDGLSELVRNGASKPDDPFNEYFNWRLNQALKQIDRNGWWESKGISTAREGHGLVLNWTEIESALIPIPPPVIEMQTERMKARLQKTSSPGATADQSAGGDLSKTNRRPRRTKFSKNVLQAALNEGRTHAGAARLLDMPASTFGDHLQKSTAGNYKPDIHTSKWIDDNRGNPKLRGIILRLRQQRKSK